MPASVFIADIIDIDGVFTITTFDSAGNRNFSNREFECPLDAEGALLDDGFTFDPSTNTYCR